MAYAILSTKLCELDEKINRLHRRIYFSESAKRCQIREEIEQIRREYVETEQMLRKRMEFSRASIVARILESYNEAEQMALNAKEKINRQVLEKEQEAASVEDRLLVAEYALDFAVQAANQALLISMEAIDAQLALQEKEEGQSL